MQYKLSEVHLKIKQFADKVGSDYFTLPELLSHFHTATLEFVGEKLKEVERNQEVTDDIRSLVVPGSLAVTRDPNDTTRWIAGLPYNYMRLLAFDVIYDDGTRCRRADMKRQAEYPTASLNPNTRPTKHYPIILQENNLLQIDCGKDATPVSIPIKYCKKPSFATSGQPDVRIVNLPDESIEAIILSTVTSLFGRTADQRVQIQNQFEKMFRTPAQ